MAESESPLRCLLSLDRTVHEPARLAVLLLLRAVERADFLYLIDETGLSKGNLSSHMTKLEDAGFIKIEKVFLGKIPRTTYQITDEGRRALDHHIRILTEALAMSE